MLQLQLQDLGLLKLSTNASLMQENVLSTMSLSCAAKLVIFKAKRS